MENNVFIEHVWYALFSCDFLLIELFEFIIPFSGTKSNILSLEKWQKAWCEAPYKDEKGKLIKG